MERFLTCAVFALVACSSAVDTDGLESTDDYRSWSQFVVTGNAAAHADSYRIIYANDIALTWSGAGNYPMGSVVIKEIYKLDSEGGQGDLSYLAIARKLDKAPPGGELDDDWLFTIAGDALPASESNESYCWSSCHISAPYTGLFHDLGE